MSRDGVSLIRAKLCRSMIFCHSRDTVAKPAKLQLTCGKASRTKRRISAGKQYQGVWSNDIGSWALIGKESDRQSYGVQQEDGLERKVL